MKQLLPFYFLLVASIFSIHGQSKRQHLKRFLVKNDTVQIDSVSISPFNFKVLDTVNNPIDTSLYHIDFSKSLLVFKTKKTLAF